jgi:hypothetical protein
MRIKNIIRGMLIINIIMIMSLLFIIGSANASGFLDTFDSSASLDNYYISLPDPAHCTATVLANGTLKTLHDNAIVSLTTKNLYQNMDNFVVEWDYKQGTSVTSNYQMWVKSNDSSRWARFTAQGTSCYLTYQDGSVHTSSAFAVTLVTGTWYHFKFYASNGNLYLDLDGINKKSYACANVATLFDATSGAELYFYRSSSYANSGQWGLWDNVYFSSDGQQIINEYTKEIHILDSYTNEHINNSVLRITNLNKTTTEYFDYPRIITVW